MTLDFIYKQHAADKQRQVDEAAQRMPDELKKFTKRLKNEYARQAKPIALDRDKQIGTIQKELNELQVQLKKVDGELEEARRNLDAIPATAEPSDVILWSTIAERWPAQRQGPLNEKIFILRKQINDIEQEFNNKCRELQIRLDGEFRQARRDLETVSESISVHRLSEQ